MSHLLLRMCLLDGSSLGHAIVPSGFQLNRPGWSIVVPMLLPSGTPGQLIPAEGRVELEQRCSWTPADFNPGDRIAWEFRESQGNSCRVYWGRMGHRCRHERGHPEAVQHSCGFECEPFCEYEAYGPDLDRMVGKP